MQITEARLPVSRALPGWSVVAPVAACVVLAVAWDRTLGWPMIAAAAIALVSVVLAAIHHAEVVAHRVGEPFGTLILAFSITVIEAGLIVSIMLAGGSTALTVARDTVFAAVMIICTGVLGLCILVGTVRHRTMAYRIEGTSPALAVLATLAVLTLVIPSFTTSTAGPSFSAAQLAFAGVISLVLYGVFVFVQTVRHRDYFLPVDIDDRQGHAAPPSNFNALVSFALLMMCLLSVIGLAKTLAPSIEAGVRAASAPVAVVGIAIAMLVLLPETGAAVRSAAANRMQTSLNLALGSALASIGLTIPTVAVVAILLELPLELGLAPKETALLALTLLVATLTLGGGRATVLQGAVHLVLFAAFVFLAVVP